jgi:hypothetical protein
MEESLWTDTNEFLNTDKIIPFEPRTELKGWPPKLELKEHPDCKSWGEATKLASSLV